MRTSGTPSPRGLFYVAGDIGDAGALPAARRSGWRRSKSRATPAATCSSTSPRSPASTRPPRSGLGAAGLGKGNGWRRLIVEKPFGHDLDSARELSDRLHEVFDESDVYRIDHYLGKETVQNILAFRFGNGIFEPLWNRRYVNHVQITAAESIGVEGRGAYYQEAGALADMIQNHLLQVMATIAMEPSASFRATSVRDERSKLLRSIRPMTPDEIRQNTVPGQYGPARIGGQDLPGFRQETGRRPAIADRHLRRGHVLRRELALGRRAVLRAHRQAPAQARHRNRHPVQPRAAGHLRRPGRRRQRAQSADRAHPARGGHLAEVPLQAARRGHEPAARLDGLQLRVELRRALALGLRDAAARRHHRRRHAVHAAGHGGGELGGGRADPERVARRPSSSFPNYAAGTWGPAAADEMLARRGHVWRKP